MMKCPKCGVISRLTPPQPLAPPKQIPQAPAAQNPATIKHPAPPIQPPPIKSASPSPQLAPPSEPRASRHPAVKKAPSTARAGQPGQKQPSNDWASVVGEPGTARKASRSIAPRRALLLCGVILASGFLLGGGGLLAVHFLVGGKPETQVTESTEQDKKPAAPEKKQPQDRQASPQQKDDESRQDAKTKPPDQPAEEEKPTDTRKNDQPTPLPAEVVEDSESLPPEEGKPLLVLDAAGHTAFVRKVFFTPDGERLITVSSDKTIRIWDVTTGETLSILRTPVGPGDEGDLYAAALSPDGTRLAVSGVPMGRGALGMLIYVLRLDTGAVERVLKGHTNTVHSLSFSSDGKRLASGSPDRTARVYDLATGRTLQVFEGHKDAILTVAFSPDSQHLATASQDQTARVWSVATGKVEAVLKGHEATVICVAWSRDGKTMATSSVDGTIRLWEPNGALRKSYGEPKKEVVQVTALVFSSDGRELLYTGIGAAGRAGMLDLKTGERRVQFPRHTNTVMHGSLSPDGKLAATTGGNDHETYLWRTDDGSVVQRLAGKGRAIWAAAWSADGNSVVWGHTNRGQPELANMPLERAFHLGDFELAGAPGDKVRRARLTSDTYSLEAIDFFKVAIKRGGKTEHVFSSPSPNDRIYCFSLVGDHHALMGAAFSLTLVDLRTNKMVRQFRGHSGIVLATAPSPDGRYFLTGCTDQTLRIWDPNHEEPLLSLFVAGNDWIAWTPEGYYAASANGERVMGWQINHGPDALASFYPAARFHKSLYQPGVLKLILQAGSVEKALAMAGNDRKQPIATVNVAQVLPPVVAVTSPAGPGLVQIKQAKLEVKATARSQGRHPVTALRLLVDGRPYQGQAGIRIVARPRPGEVRASWTVELTPGRHALAVIAESAVSKGLSESVEVVHTGAKPAGLPNLNVLAIGVSDYPGDLKLHYAAADAEAIAKVFKEKSGRAFDKIEIKLLTDKRVTRRSILQGLDWLDKQMNPRDVAVIFLSGHGTKDPDGNFYYVPADVDLNRPAGTCLSGEELKKRLEAMPGRIIAVFDACHSGAAAQKQRSRPGALTDDLVRDLVTEDYGVIVMCSSLGGEASIESSEIEHGFFTMALVEGLSGRADFNKDGIIHFSELDQYAGIRVKQLSAGKQTPVTARPSTVRSFPLAKH
jgi:WD40 repeat protein